MKTAIRWVPVLPVLAVLAVLSAFSTTAYPSAAAWPTDSWLGVTVRPVDFETLDALELEYGVLVAHVFPDSPASRAGIQRGDILLELDGKPLYSVGRLNWLLRKGLGPEKSSLAYFRSDRSRTVDIELKRLPPHRQGPYPWGMGGWPSASYLGVHLQAMTNELREVFGAPENEGVLIVKVMPDSPARDASLAVGDVLVRMDRKTIRQIPDVHRVLTFFEPGDLVEIELIRDRQRRVLTVTLSDRPGAGPSHADPGSPPSSPPPPMQPRHWQQLLDELEEMWEKLWQDLSEDRMKRAPDYL